jgi:hypothetical protein
MVPDEVSKIRKKLKNLLEILKAEDRGPMEIRDESKQNYRFSRVVSFSSPECRSKLGHKNSKHVI